MTNFADAECRSDYFAERPEPDHPSPSELIDDSAADPNTRTCVAAWISHTRDEWAACIFCQGRAPLCRWANDRCQHGAFRDDPTTSFDTTTRRHYCGTYESRAA